MNVTVDRIVADEGSVVLFSGLIDSTPGTYRRITFAVDHRPAQDIVDALLGDELPECEITHWQIIGWYEKVPKTGEA